MEFLRGDGAGLEGISVGCGEFWVDRFAEWDNVGCEWAEAGRRAVKRDEEAQDLYDKSSRARAEN